MISGLTFSRQKRCAPMFSDTSSARISTRPKLSCWANTAAGVSPASKPIRIGRCGLYCRGLVATCRSRLNALNTGLPRWL
ncbi:hypothetical protein D3C75_1044460 [compost metagenome]